MHTENQKTENAVELAPATQTIQEFYQTHGLRPVKSINWLVSEHLHQLAAEEEPVLMPETAKFIWNALETVSMYAELVETMMLEKGGNNGK